MEGTCEYNEYAVADNRQGVVLYLWGWAKGLTRLTIKTLRVTQWDNKPPSYADALQRICRIYLAKNEDTWRSIVDAVMNIQDRRTSLTNKCTIY